MKNNEIFDTKTVDKKNSVYSTSPFLPTLNIDIPLDKQEAKIIRDIFLPLTVLVIVQ